MALHIARVSNDFIRRIAQEYLLDFATMKRLARTYKTSPSTISNILFKGVAECILDDLTAEAVAAKAMSNTDNVVRTRKRWEKALELRKLPLFEEELASEKKKFEELQFQLEHYEDYFLDDACAPTERGLRCQVGRLKGDIRNLENYIANLKG